MVLFISLLLSVNPVKHLLTIFRFCSSGLQVEGYAQDNPLEHMKKLLEIICQWEIKLHHYFTYQLSLVFSSDHLSDGYVSLQVRILHGESIDEALLLIQLLSHYFEILKDT